VRFLVDGYNLMHAAGYLTARPTGRLDPARRRFLDWLAGVAAARAVSMRVVFDGQKSPRPSPETDHRGVRVRFAFGQAADDEIETLLTGPSRDVVVVSNDSRLHESARRAGAAAWPCDKFLDWVVREPSPSPPAVDEPPEKPVNAAEDAALLEVFQAARGRRR
jgi:predicted RNA-binding protein with PIN domain